MNVILLAHQANLVQRRRIPRVLRDRNDPMAFSDADLMKRYRFPRSTILDINSVMLPYTRPSENRPNAIQPIIQKCTTLNYLATGCLYSNLQASFDVSRASISRIIARCVNAMIATMKEDVRFNMNELEANALSFHELANFPNVLGCIDGTQVAIKCPNRNEHAYVNRKGFHSINIQFICDANMMFLDAVVKYPGSAHDSFIFGQSQIKERLLTGDFGDKWLLGDSSYALRSYLLTPYLSCNSQGERNFNRSHKRTRVQIERSFGIPKSRFLCLSHKVSGPLPFVPEKCCKVIWRASSYITRHASRISLILQLSTLKTMMNKTSWLTVM